MPFVNDNETNDSKNSYVLKVYFSNHYATEVLASGRL